MKNRLIFLSLVVLLLSGCDNRECVKSHQEQSVCVYSMWNGKTVIPYTLPCTVTVCDEYEEIENESK